MVYENGKIYTIRSHETDKYYIGATCQPLHKRFHQHKNDYQKFLQNKYTYVSSFDIIQYDDCYIELLEIYPCNSKEELNKYEGECIRKYKNEVVNKQITGRTNKEYREDNKEGISKQRKQYRNDNKEKVKEQKKQHYTDNKDIILQKQKQYRDENKMKIRERKQQKYTCECGSTLRHEDKARHERTIVHHKWLESKGEQ